MNKGHRIYQFILLIMVFLYFEILLPASVGVLKLDEFIRFIISCAIINFLYVFINKVCKYFLPWLKKYFRNNQLVLRLIQIENFLKDIEPQNIVDHNKTKVKKLLWKMSFIYVISGILYYFICWSLTQIKEILKAIKNYQYEHNIANTAKQ